MTKKVYRSGTKRRPPAKVREAAPVLVVPGAVYTLQEACAALRISEATARRWIKDGRLVAHKIGRDYRLLGRDLEEGLRRPAEDDLRGLVLTRDHPFWALVGMMNTGEADVSENHHRYLSEAYE